MCVQNALQFFNCRVALSDCSGYYHSRSDLDSGQLGFLASSQRPLPQSDSYRFIDVLELCYWFSDKRLILTLFMMFQIEGKKKRLLNILLLGNPSLNGTASKQNRVRGHHKTNVLCPRRVYSHRIHTVIVISLTANKKIGCNEVTVIETGIPRVILSSSPILTVISVDMKSLSSSSFTSPYASPWTNLTNESENSCDAVQDILRTELVKKKLNKKK